MKELRFIIFIIGIFLLYACGTKRFIKDLPDLSRYDTIPPKVTKINDSLFISGPNYLTKNKYNQWELYIQGDPLHRGMLAGALMDSLIEYQENATFESVLKLIPSKVKQKFILGWLRAYNRNIFKYIPEEYKVELFGMSKYLSDKYDFVAPPYPRQLFLHAAHDIGHALINFSLINECTSAALWGKKTPNGELIVGRNLDFYTGKKFAENQLILFNNPKKGIPYVSVAWPGMMGVMSGMNLTGLTITMNAGKSKIPWSAKEPISILARDILEHASTIDEAIKIAKKNAVFVSESLLITSAKDNRAVTLELSPKNFGVYEVGNNQLVCTNHFQSKAYKDDNRNQERIKNGHSLYRYKRMNELLDSVTTLTPQKMVAILRNKKGLGGVPLGYGNEKAINQLLSHHGVVFLPSQHKIWISSHPYNLGSFTCYDLDEVFDPNRQNNYQPQYIDSLTIPADPFLYSQDYKDYEHYRKLDRVIDHLIDNKKVKIDEDILNKYRNLNPNLWSVYYKTGMLYYREKKYHQAQKMFKKALTKVITTLPDKLAVKKILKKTNKKL